MKHIKKIDELYKKTYISAAEKLDRNHRDRSKELINWADKNGIPDPVERDHPHRFYFSRYKDYAFSKLSGYYSIIGIKEMESHGYRQGISVYTIDFKSDYGEEARINLLFQEKKPEWVSMKFLISYITHEGNKDWTPLSDNFLFENRKDAIEFKKYVCESMPDSKEIISKLNLNSMYTTNNAWYKRKS